MVRSARARRSGFTIIELMITLVVIGIMAATVAPTLGEMLADNRQSSAAMDVVRLARQTRAQASLTGVAQLMRFRGAGDAASGFGLGTVSVYAGMNNKCRQTPWAAAWAAAAGTGHDPKIFHMGEYNPKAVLDGLNGTNPPRATDTGRHVIALSAHITLETNPAQNALLICYQPNGEIYTGAALPVAIQTQPIVLRVRRWIDEGGGDIERGRERQVLFPVGGNARLR